MILRRSRLASTMGLFLCGCATMGGGTAPIAPVGGGARQHFAPPPKEDPGEQTDPLRRSLLATIAEAAQQKGVPAPESDLRLELFADELAGAVQADEVPGVELQEFLLSHFGLGDPPPQLRMVQVMASDEAIRDRMAKDLPDLLATGEFGRVGIGVVRRWPKTSLVLALQRIDVEMLPVPRRLELGASALIGGRLLRGLEDPRVQVAPPEGDVVALPVRAAPGGFQTSFACDRGAGRYQVEVTGRGSAGKLTVANFPVYCGADPPRTFPRGAISRPESQDPRQAEAMLLEKVNQDRAKVGAPPVTWDEGLAQVARGHSQDMANRQVVGHLSPETGNAASRVKAAGVEASVLLENVGRANSVADAQRSFLTSPGHRANVLDRSVTRLGIGIVFRGEGGAVPSLYVTQLFAR